MKIIKAIIAKPFVFKLHGKIKENDHVEVEDLELGIFWIIMFIIAVAI